MICDIASESYALIGIQRICCSGISDRGCWCRRGAAIFGKCTHSEFGIRLALGSQPERLLKTIVNEGAIMATGGIVAGAAFGFVVFKLAHTYIAELTMPGFMPVIASASILLVVAIIASLLPAARASRVNVIEALRSE
jgi:ABC-type lipoprotein release transport system permease subunit